MADYVIGDVQGCYESLMRLLEKINFDESSDRLWFVGDLVNRGPQSLAVLRFLKHLNTKPFITLGNHDLHLLGRIFGTSTFKDKDDTLGEIVEAPDALELGHWLRQQSILLHDKTLNIVVTHAGIAPIWNLEQAKALASELETALRGDSFLDFLSNMYGNEPKRWSDALLGNSRLRVICNYFTRMRFCTADGGLDFTHKGTIDKAPTGLFPWFECPGRIEIEPDLIFGHWAALRGKSSHPRIHAIDTGCLWGGYLTAFRLQDKHRIVVSGFA